MIWGKETGLVTKPSRINTVMEGHGLISRPESALRPDPVDSRQDLTTSVMKMYMRSPGPSPKGGQPFIPGKGELPFLSRVAGCQRPGSN